MTFKIFAFVLFILNSGLAVYFIYLAMESLKIALGQE